MKAIYTFISTPGEGGNIHIESFIKAFRAIGGTLHTVSIARAPYRANKDEWSVFRKLWVKGKWVLSNIKNAAILLKASKRSGAEVVIFRFDPMHDFCLGVALISKLWPVVLEVNAVRSLENYQNRPRISDFLDAYTLSAASHITVISRRVKEHLLQIYKLNEEKITVVENGVDPNEFHPGIDGSEMRRALGLEHAFVYCFVGSFRPWHGISHLIDAAELLVSKRANICLLLVGDGPSRPEYEERVKASKLQHNVIFTGRVSHDQVAQFLAASDVLLAPVQRQSFSGEFHGSPLKLFEYMAMAKPVIASPYGQAKEVIQDQRSGFLVDCENPRALSECLMMLSNDQELRDSVGKAARQRVLDAYTWEINAKKVFRLCEAVISQHAC